MAHWFINKKYDNTDSLAKDLDEYEATTNYSLKIYESRTIETFCKRRRITETFEVIKYYKCYWNCITHVVGKNTDK